MLVLGLSLSSFLGMLVVAARKTVQHGLAFWFKCAFYEWNYAERKGAYPALDRDWKEAVGDGNENGQQNWVDEMVHSEVSYFVSESREIRKETLVPPKHSVLSFQLQRQQK